MKNILFYLITGTILMFSILSCNQKSKNAKSSSDNDIKEKNASKEQVTNFTIKETVADYLTLKNALIADNSEAAANAGKKLLETLNAVDITTVPAEKQQEYTDIAEDAKENAEHISKNKGNIIHQRGHLTVLSKDVNDLIILFGTSQKLYQFHCPIYDNGKGAIWISETDTVKNPYYGNRNKLFSCGMVKKTF